MYLTLKETAEQLKLSERTVTTYIKNDLLRAAKISGQWRIKSEWIDQMLEDLSNRGPVKIRVWNDRPREDEHELDEATRLLRDMKRGHVHAKES